MLRSESISRVLQQNKYTYERSVKVPFYYMLSYLNTLEVPYSSMHAGVSAIKALGDLPQT